MPLLQKQKPHLAQTVCTRHWQSRLALWADQDKALLKQRDFLKTRLRHGQGEDRCIKPPFIKLFQKLGGQCFTHLNIKPRIFRRQCFKNPRQKIRRNCRNNAEPQSAAKLFLRLARHFLKFFRPTQNTSRMTAKILTKRRKPDLPCPALEQRHAKLGFKFLDLHRERRLRHRAKLRRTAKMPLTRKSLKIAQLFQCDVCHK